MIKSVKIGNGPIQDIGIIKDLTFTPGVNIIFSPNGSGKSVLLKSVSHYFPLQYPTPLQDGYVWDKYIDRTINKLDIEYDGGAIHYFDNFSIQDARGQFLNAQDGQGNFAKAVSNLMNKPSSGQKSIIAINDFMNLSKVVEFPKPSGNDLWIAAQQNFINYYNSFPKDGRPTILLDELDASLDPDKSLMFLDSVLSTLAGEGWQVICVTHNPLVLYMDWYNILNFYPDQSKELKYRMNWLFNNK